MDDDRTLRRRLEDLEAEVERRAGAAPAGAAAMLAKTATKATYPTVAGAYYWMQEYRLGGTPTEGAAGVLTARSFHFYAWNRGTSVPPAGTVVLVTQVSSGRWTFFHGG